MTQQLLEQIEDYDRLLENLYSEIGVIESKKKEALLKQKKCEKLLNKLKDTVQTIKELAEDVGEDFLNEAVEIVSQLALKETEPQTQSIEQEEPLQKAEGRQDKPLVPLQVSFNNERSRRINEGLSQSSITLEKPVKPLPLKPSKEVPTVFGSLIEDTEVIEAECLEAEGGLIEQNHRVASENNYFAWKTTSNPDLAYFIDVNKSSVHCVYVGAGSKAEANKLLVALQDKFCGINLEIRHGSRLNNNYEIKVKGLNFEDISVLSATL